MDNVKNGRPGAATPKRPADKQSSGAEALSQNQCIMSGGNVQGLFQNILQHGAENAIRAQDLADVLGLSDVRSVGEMIAREREAGAVILSDCRGYFLPAEGDQGRDEAARFVSTLRARALNTLKATKSAKAYLDALPGQLYFESEGEPCQEEP